MSEICRGKPAFILLLFDYTQVKRKVYLHPLKITFSPRTEREMKKKSKRYNCREKRQQTKESPLDINPDILIFHLG